MHRMHSQCIILDARMQIGIECANGGATFVVGTSADEDHSNRMAAHDGTTISRRALRVVGCFTFPASGDWLWWRFIRNGWPHRFQFQAQVGVVLFSGFADPVSGHCLA